MSYTAQNNQTYARTGSFYDPWIALSSAEAKGWEECETDLMKWKLVGETLTLELAEFPCTYRFHYGDESHECELTANRPDSYCEVHSA